MSIRRAVKTAATFVVACILALAVPVSQLRLVAVQAKCCCPDPTRCHCPDHTPGDETNPSVRACHKSQTVLASTSAPAFDAPRIASAAAPQIETFVPALLPASPKPPPVPAPPYGPS